MVEEDLSDINHELTVVSLFDGGIRASTAVIVYSLLTVLIAWTAITEAIEERSVLWLLIFIVFTVVMVHAISKGWRNREQLFIDGQRAVLKGSKIPTEVIEFGPHVEAETRMNKDDRSNDGWGGFYGMTLKDGDTEIPIASRYPFKEEDVKAFWPDFVRLVRTHGMQRGPVLAKVLEMSEMGEGRLVLDPGPKWGLPDVPLV